MTPYDIIIRNLVLESNSDLIMGPKDKIHDMTASSDVYINGNLVVDGESVQEKARFGELRVSRDSYLAMESQNVGVGFKSGAREKLHVSGNVLVSANAIIGGEGNGGVIYPALHYGRDALVGVALFLTQLAERKISAKKLRDSYPDYFISKNKIELHPEKDIESIFSSLEKKYKNEKITTEDGLKIDFEDGWVHLRKSNTEPIIRIYAESKSEEKANEFADKMIDDINLLY